MGYDTTKVRVEVAKVGRVTLHFVKPEVLDGFLNEHMEDVNTLTIVIGCKTVYRKGGHK